MSAMRLFCLLLCLPLLLAGCAAGTAGSDSSTNSLSSTDEALPEKQGVPDGYELVWGDEFDGDTLDESKWRIYDGELDSSAGGKVQLIANEQTVTVHDGLVTMQYFKTDDGTGWYGSDALKTTETMRFHCGYLEMRARLPDAVGVYSSFWTSGNEKDMFEIDIFESLGLAHRLTANVHKWPSAESGQQHSSLDGVVDGLSRRYFLPGSAFSDDFHTFALLWTEEKMTFYCDGEQYFAHELDEYFKDKYQCIITGFNVGWKDRTPPDAALTYPIEMDIDYIRLYQRPGSTALRLGK